MVHRIDVDDYSCYCYYIVAENQHYEDDEDIVCIVMVILEKVLPMKEHNRIVLVSVHVFYNAHPKTYWQVTMLLLLLLSTLDNSRWSDCPS
jgi:hypothetical protein